MEKQQWLISEASTPLSYYSSSKIDAEMNPLALYSKSKAWEDNYCTLLLFLVFFFFFFFLLKCGLAILFSAKSFKQLSAWSGLWINLSSINSIFVLVCAFEVFQNNFSLKTGYRPTSCLLIKGICEMPRLTKRLNAWVINATHFNLNEIILISPESLKVSARLILLCPA